MEPSFASRLPKVELHAHLNGSLSENTLKELYALHQKNNSNQLSDWDSSNFIKDSYSLSSFFDLFNMTYKLTSTPEAVQIATERVIEEFAEDNVIYLELRSTLRKEENMTKREYLEAMIEAVENCERKFPNIIVKLIISINRSEPVESAEENVKLAIEYLKLYSHIVVGIDTSGNPSTSSFSDFVDVLNMARAAGLKITVHCGEVVGNEEIKKILDFKPDRIGHGTCIHESLGGDATNWDLLLKKRIPVEICLTSNIKCKTVESLDKHHFKLLYDAKHPISLATDDKGVFNTTSTKEHELAQKAFGLSDDDLWYMTYSSIEYTFTDGDEKHFLYLTLKQFQIGNI